MSPEEKKAYKKAYYEAKKLGVCSSTVYNYKYRESRNE